MATDPRAPRGKSLTGRAGASLQRPSESPAQMIARYSSRLAALPDIAPLLDAARKRPQQDAAVQADSIAMLAALDNAQQAIRAILLRDARAAAP